MSPTILLVEDETDLAAACVRLLERRGWRVETEGSCAAALGAVARRPALVIVDRELPDGDGFDVVRAAVAAGTPVVVVSGHDWTSTRRMARDQGAAAFLGKPFAVRDLVGVVEDILRRSPAAPPAPRAAQPARFGRAR